jgi:enamine deaminase RidA (YjgF/YER057c/UK114 family)
MIGIKRFETGPRMSQVVVHNGTAYLAGQVAGDVSTDVADQTRQVLAKIDGFLAAAGTDKSKLLMTTIWLANIKDFAAMNQVWDAWVSPGNTPARACVESRLARPQIAVEIRVIAAV